MEIKSPMENQGNGDQVADGKLGRWRLSRDEKLGRWRSSRRYRIKAVMCRLWKMELALI
nr:hypothetical protein Iba_scaffold39297CG0020 [Ipomoea batatas]